MSSIFEYFPSSRIELFELGEDEEKTLVHIFCAKNQEILSENDFKDC